MTKSEAATLLRYALSMYPGVKMGEAQIESTAQTWAVEFAGESCEAVGEAFRLARDDSPQWMPSVPQIMAALRELASQARSKTPEDEFRDSHGGKSPEEWAEYQAWATSDEGRTAIDGYKAKLLALIGV